jgi:mannitol/fructose-specific phosphotransferase system IIA component (Ntr-type)
MLFAGLMLTVGRWLINRSLPWIQAHTTWPGGMLGFAVTLAFLCAAFTEAIGIHAIFGAFLFGVALGDSHHLRQRTRRTIDQFVSFIFAPLFFASIGLHVNFVRNFDLQLFIIVLVIASVGKIIGCGLAARWMGFPANEARAIGYGMNARGAMEIILGILALEAGIIGDRLFVALVLMAIITSMSSGWLIQRAFGRRKATQLTEILTVKTFIPKLAGNDRESVIRELARLAAEVADIDQAMAFNNVWFREQMITSALGGGIAVPHAQLAGLKQPAAAVGLCPDGIDFDAPDGQPVRLVVLLLTPIESIGVHLDLMASIARLFRDPRVVRDVSSRVSNYTEFLALLNIESPRVNAPIPG